MAWFKVDDGFYDNPKVVGLSHEATALWLLAGTWASKQLTDGRVPSAMVGRLGCSSDAAEELVTVGLWDRINGDYEYHDWEDYQPTRAAVEERRRVRAEAGRKGGLKSGKAGVKHLLQRMLRTQTKQTRTPSRPVPSRTSTHLLRVSPVITVRTIRPTQHSSDTSRRLASQAGIEDADMLSGLIRTGLGITVPHDRLRLVVEHLRAKSKKPIGNLPAYLATCMVGTSGEELRKFIHDTNLAG